MIARKVLIVLREQLRVLEGNHLARDCFYYSRGITDARYLSRDVVNLDEVAHFDTSRHEGNTIVDILDDVLRCETDTGRQTSGHNGKPGHGDIKNAHRNKEPQAPNQHLKHILAHHLATGGSLRILVLIVHTHQFQEGAVDVGKEEPQADHHGQRYDAQLEILHIDKLHVEDAPTEVGEVEDVCRPIDADHHRRHAQDRQQHLIGQMVGPRLGNGTLSEAVTLAIELDISADTCNG